jgi:hypothetical protein
MTLLSPFSDPVALKLLGAARRGRSWASVLPPITTTDRGCVASAGDTRRCEVAVLLTVGLLGDPPDPASIGELEQRLDPHVVTWTPSIHLSSRDSLIAALGNADDAIAGVRVTPTASLAAPDHVYLEWTIAGTFRRAGFLNDDVLIEPSGAPVEAAGVLAATFEQDHVVRIHCYYDRLAILEQVLRPPSTP